MLSLDEILFWANAKPGKRNFNEGERTVLANHLIFCKKNVVAETVKITAYCLSVKNLRGDPYEIKGVISNRGKIISFTCECPAGLGKICKHVVATLLYCYRYLTNFLANFLLFF